MNNGIRRMGKIMSNKTKYMRIVETTPEIYDKFLDKIPKMQEDEKKNPEKYPKTLYPPHTIGGEAKSFSIVEGTPEQVMNYIAFWRPFKSKFIPIFESDKIIEKYKKSK
jgi:hypothetical protein